jgi:hypothetical protein
MSVATVLDQASGLFVKPVPEMANRWHKSLLNVMGCFRDVLAKIRASVVERLASMILFMAENPSLLWKELSLVVMLSGVFEIILLVATIEKYHFYARIFDVNVLAESILAPSLVQTVL